MQDERDDRIDQTIDKALAALRQATPPDGIEARIEHRLLQHQRAAALRPGWRDTLRGSTIAGGWLRGAFSGACFATGIIAVLLSLHHPKSTVTPAAPINAYSGFIQTFPKLAVEQHSRPCTPTILQANAPPALQSTEIARGALPENHRQPLELPLTRQERDLVRLVHIAGPEQLASMSTEERVRTEAQEEASFDKFFTPPPPPKPIAETASPADTPPAADSQSPSSVPDSQPSTESQKQER